MVNRREFLGIAAGAGAALAIAPELLRAHQSAAGKLMMRAIPSSAELLPIVSFNPQQETDDAEMQNIVRTLRDNGGKVVDFPHGGGEEKARAAAGALGTLDKLFWTTPLYVTPAYAGPLLPGAIARADPAAVKAAMEEKLARYNVPESIWSWSERHPTSRRTSRC